MGFEMRWTPSAEARVPKPIAVELIAFDRVATVGPNEERQA
jgi:hypothetical protein